MSTVAVVDSAKFFRGAGGVKAVQLGLTECNPTTGECNGQAVVVATDGKTDTFCGGIPSATCSWPYRIDDGNISISTTGS